MRKRSRYLPVVLALALSIPTAAAEAGGQSPQLRKIQDVIVTQTSSGEEVRGQLVELSSRSVEMLVNNQRVEIPLDSVLRVEVRGDPVKNGAIIGAVVLGGWCAIICGQGLIDSSQLPAAIATNAAFGALMGAGIDALHKGRSTIYSKPAAASLAPERPGPRMSFRLRF